MKTIKLVIGSIALSLAVASCCQKKASPTAEPDMKHLLLATAWYQQSAEMRACYYQAYTMAKMALRENLQNHRGAKPAAVVLDIDETVLDNSPFEAKPSR